MPFHYEWLSDQTKMICILSSFVYHNGTCSVQNSVIKTCKKKEANPIKVSDIGEIVENGDHFLQHINVAH